MKRPVMKCPFCGGTLRNTDLHPGRPVVCPSCKTELQASDAQLWLSGFIALCITATCLYFMGVRGVWFFVAVVVLWFPAYVIWDYIFLLIVPPRFEAFVPKDHKGKTGDRRDVV